MHTSIYSAGFWKTSEKMEMLGLGTAAKSVVAPPGVREESMRESIVRAHMSRFCLTTPDILLDTSGRAHPVKEMTTSSTAILLTKRYPNPSDCKSGTKRCWTSLCQSASSMITRCVKCVLGGYWPSVSWFLPCFMQGLSYCLMRCASFLVFMALVLS